MPERLGSGHRRYSERDVATIRSAVRDRSAGVPIGIALERAKAAARGPRSSVFGALRHTLSDVPASTMTKPALIALSRAIEDEIAARAERPTLIAAFQQARFWHGSETRWRHLAHTSAVTVVLASFRRARRGAVWEIPIDVTAQLAREWIVICDSPTFSACLAAVEFPPGDARQFEALWTTEPLVVRDVARVAAAIASTRQPELEQALAQTLQGPATLTYDTLRVTTSLTNRVVGYLTT